ncbi:MAG: hypothetical protein ABIP44_03580, partial [Pseudoxanthomonas sp.]
FRAAQLRSHRDTAQEDCHQQGCPQEDRYAQNGDEETGSPQSRNQDFRQDGGAGQGRQQESKAKDRQVTNQAAAVESAVNGRHSVPRILLQGSM